MERKINRQQERTRREKAEQRNAWKKKHIQRQLVTYIPPKCVHLKNNTGSYMDAVPYLRDANSLLQIRLGGYAPVVNLILSYLPPIVCYECGTQNKITLTCDQCSRYYCYECIDTLNAQNFDRRNDMNKDDIIYHRMECRYCNGCDECKGVCFCHFNGFYRRSYTLKNFSFLGGGSQVVYQRGLLTEYWDHKRKTNCPEKHIDWVRILKTYSK